MTATELAKLTAKERDALLAIYFGPAGGSAAAGLIERLELAPGRRELLREAVGLILTDVYYGLLLALDGNASLGGVQQTYQLRDEDGNLLTGDLEEAAWEGFHGSGA